MVEHGMRSKGEVGIFKAGLRVMRVENCFLVSIERWI
jgi:hypothetical protein